MRIAPRPNLSRTVLTAVALCAAGSVADAQRAGLLLGVEPSATLWIAVRGDTVSARWLRGLVVPRRSGFWEVGTSVATHWRDRRGCHVTMGDAPRTATATRAASAGLWAAPLGARPLRKRPEYAWLCAATWDGDSDSGVDDELELTFVGTDHIAFVYRYVKSGDSAPNRLFSNHGYLLSLDTLARQGYSVADDAEPESVAPMDPDNRERTWAACQLEAARRLSKDSTLTEPGELAYDLGLTDVWTIVRGEGRWVYRRELVSDCNACNNESTECPMHEPPPRSVVGHDSLVVPLARIRERVPAARDAFSSPGDGGIVAVGIDSALVLFRANDGALTDSLASVPLPPDARVVMAQWALGAGVARWDAALRPRRVKRVP